MTNQSKIYIAGHRGLVGSAIWNNLEGKGYTNLYGPNDNFDLERSHVLPALIRKIHLGKCLEDNNWPAIRNDLNRRPIGDIDGSATEDVIIDTLQQYGIRVIRINSRNSCSIEIWGTGATMREFLWSEEMADACVFVMERVNFSDVARGQEVRNTHINIGTGNEISIRGLAELICQTVGFNGELLFNASKPDGTMRKLIDVSKLHSLGWHHRIEIEEGIKKIYRWYGGE
jgi:GDP-L-fucose synthase